MDDKPLKESKKVLVQVGTVARPTDWTTEPATFQYRTSPSQGEKILPPASRRGASRTPMPRSRSPTRA